MKRVSKVVLLVLLLLTLCSCGKERYSLSYYDEIGESYNDNLFYKNEITAFGADPGVIAITDKSDKDNFGSFYLYPTSDFDGATQRIIAYKSDDLENWQSVSIAFEPDNDSYMSQDFWAPEVIYDAEEDQSKYGIGNGKGVYFMFFSSNDKDNEKELVFETHAAEKEYKKIVEKVSAYSYPTTLNTLNSYIRAYKNKNGSLYKEECYLDAMEIITDYEYNVTTQADKQVLAKEALLALSTVHINAITVKNDYAIGLAVSTKPQGPFVQYTRLEAKDGERIINKTSPFLCSEDMYEYADAANVALTGMEEGFSMIDPHPFVDPQTKDKYLFFVRRSSRSYIEGNFICAIKMGKSWSDDPDWSTLTRIASNNLVTPYGSEICDTDVEAHLVNEGPYVYYKDGTYYLTYSVGNYNNTTYSTCQAISNKVLGEYRKLQSYEGGYILTADGRTDVSAPGHHSFVEYNGDLYIVYHAHWDKVNNSGQRGFNVDKCYFTKNDDGQEIIQCNGPTSSIQPLIGNNAEYKNIISNATITAKNVDEETLQYLTDDKIDCYSFVDFIKECEAEKKAEITIEFDDYKTIRSIMVYNSKDTDKSFKEVNEIEFYFKDKEGKEKVAVIQNLKFNANYINDAGLMNRCSAAVAEFNELSVNKIVLKFNEENNFEINEIYVLGK